jgi:hypothetical protein
MRLLSLVMQNKKGENVVIATSPSILTRNCILYSNMIYEYILETYRKSSSYSRQETQDLKDHHASGQPLLRVEHLQIVYSLHFCSEK